MTVGKQKLDFMQVAREIVEQAIGEKMDGTPLEKSEDTRNPARCTRQGRRQEGRYCTGETANARKTSRHSQEGSKGPLEVIG